MLNFRIFRIKIGYGYSKNLSDMDRVKKSISAHLCWAQANNSGRNLDLNKIRFSHLHYSLPCSRVLVWIWIWKTEITLLVSGKDTRSRYETHCYDHDMQILKSTTIRCQWVVPTLTHQWKQSLKFASTGVGDTSSLKCSIAQLDSQNRKLPLNSIITEAKNLNFLCVNELGLSIRNLEIL